MRMNVDVAANYTAADLQELIDREVIRDVLHRYAHAIDRCDAKLLATVYWPEGIDDHSDFVGKRDAFIEWVMPQMKAKMTTSQHMMVNELIRIEGNIAKVETCFQAYHRWGAFDEKGAEDFVIGGRYLDRMEKRGREWRVIHRVVAFDYFREYPDTGNWRSAKYVTAERVLGTRKPEDPVVAWFGDSIHKTPFV
jgi:hypothetical protein